MTVTPPAFEHPGIDIDHPATSTARFHHHFSARLFISTRSEQRGRSR
jgi:hypothetical protein